MKCCDYKLVLTTNVYILQRLLADMDEDKGLVELLKQLKQMRPAAEKVDHWDAVDN